jgi:hypothetical protein
MCCGYGDGDGGGDGLADGIDQLCGNAFLYDVDVRAIGDTDRYGRIYRRIVQCFIWRTIDQHIDGSDHSIIQHTRDLHGDVHGACHGGMCIGDGDGDGGGDGIADGDDQLCGNTFLYDVDIRSIGDADGYGRLHRRVIFIFSCRIEYQYIDGSDHSIDEYPRDLHGDVHGACLSGMCCGYGDGDGGGDGLADGIDQLCWNAFLYDVDIRAIGNADRYGRIYRRIIQCFIWRTIDQHIDGSDHPFFEHARYIHGDVHSTELSGMCCGDGVGYGGGDGAADGDDQLCWNAFLYDVDIRAIGNADRYGRIYRRNIQCFIYRTNDQHIDGSDHAFFEYARYVHGDVHSTELSGMCCGDGDGDGGGDGAADGDDLISRFAILHDIDSWSVGYVDGHRRLYGRVIFIFACRVNYQYIDGCDHAIIQHSRDLHGDVRGASLGGMCYGDGDGDGGGDGFADGLFIICIRSIL